ncbi:hypothetical protein Tco_1232515 [Tanacetum coccineum]
MWIIGSLCDSLQEQVVTTLGNAKALWDHLKELFHDNKDAKAINLDNKLRSIKIKKIVVNEYCTKIKSMADRLKNLGNMLLLKESSFHDESGASTTFESSSSSTNRTYGIFIIKQQSLPHPAQHGLLHQIQNPNQAQQPLMANQLPQQVYYTSPSPQQHPGQGLPGPAPTQYASRPTSIPSAFSTMTL